ncbi:MAG: SDR family oxidoreductase [Pseudomonadota bacterium]
MTLADKHILIVGGSSGMGFAAAQAALAQGARVTIASRSEGKLAQAKAALGGTAETIVLDMTDEAQVQTAFEQVPDGSVDALVISASAVAHGPFATAKTPDIRAMFESKFLGAYITAREALPKLRKGGSITFVSGVLSRKPGRNGAGLAAVNAALEALGRALALELGPDIRVNTVAPGMTRTEAYAGMPDAQREGMYKAVGDALPVGRIADPSEIAEAILFAATNGFLTGHTLDIDGGHLIG